MKIHEKKVAKIDVKGVDKETGSIINEEQFKKSLLNFFNSSPEKYSGSIKEIDSIVNNYKAAQSGKSTNNNQKEVAPSFGEISPSYIVGQGWSTDPHVTFSQDRVTYSMSWITEDNYRSSVPITATYTKTLKTSATLGFTGSNLIQSKLGFSAAFNVEQTTTITQGANVPAWTVWGMRPYIKYNLEEWEGIYYYIDSTGGIVQVIEGPVTGTNKKLITKSNEYWSRTNTTHDLNATTPTPSTGAPNV
ncbi:hypothetical protein [Paenibacillus durus]|uniref:Uncharacterized protein n=1 Tax=Paenibacillus durus TaxID=44251 RepID=A0A089HUN0_PAEDU|nr:hypothetical protein [Paenibacillus durus]AIQ14430.1 hypothetical protein PDUR_22885 [Paenibacillus durus]